jgi:hypothetical protein
MKNKAFLSIVFAAFCTFSLSIGPAHGQDSAPRPTTKVKLPGKPQDLELAYDVYAGGFKALHADFDIKLDPNAYDVALTAHTQGMIGGIFPWEGAYRTAGHTRNNALVPNQHTARSTWKEKEKLTELRYSPQGNLLKMTTQEGGKTTTKRDIQKELSQDSVDLLTGAVLMIQSARLTDTCHGSFPVFDGKRRYNLTLYGGGPDEIRKSDYSVFSGKALKCFLKVEPVAGFVKKDEKRGFMAVQNHTLARKKPPTIWFAQVEKDGPTVPVRMEINSAYGAAVAHLTATADATAKKN